MKYCKIQLPDDFEKGACMDCPFSYQEWDTITDEWCCVLLSIYDECPLVIEEDDDEK